MSSVATNTFHLICSKSEPQEQHEQRTYQDNIALLCLIVLIQKDEDSALFGYLLKDIPTAVLIDQINQQKQAVTKQDIQAGLKDASNNLAYLRRKLEKKALNARQSNWGYVKWLAMHALLWSLLLLFALGCALSVLGGLVSKFGKSIDSGSALGLKSLYGGFLLISLATIYTNIIGFKRDCEDFMHTLFATNTSAPIKDSDPTKNFDPNYTQNLTRWLLSLTAGVTLGLTTWHFMSIIPFMKAIPHVGIVIIVISVATGIAELMLTTGVIKNFLKQFNEWRSKKPRPSLGQTIFGEAFSKSSKTKKFFVIAVAAILSVITILGLYALSKSGIDAMQEISFTKTLPQYVSIIMSILTCLSQLPLYLKGAFYLSGKLSSRNSLEPYKESSWQKFKAAFNIKRVLKNLAKFTGFCTMGGALATLSCIVLGGGLAALTPHMVPVLVGVSIAYGAWLMLQYHLKSVRVLTNAGGNATLATSPHPSLGTPGVVLGMTADGVMSTLFGTYGLMKDNQDSVSTEQEVRTLLQR